MNGISSIGSGIWFEFFIDWYRTKKKVTNHSSKKSCQSCLTFQGTRGVSFSYHKQQVLLFRRWNHGLMTKNTGDRKVTYESPHTVYHSAASEPTLSQQFLRKFLIEVVSVWREKHPKPKNNRTPQSYMIKQKKINTGAFQLWKWLVFVTGCFSWARTSQNTMSDVTGFQGLIPDPTTYSLGAVRVPGKLLSLTLKVAELRESQAPADASRLCPRIRGLRARGRAQLPVQPSWGQPSMGNVSAGLGTTSHTDPVLHSCWCPKNMVCCFRHSSMPTAKQLSGCGWLSVSSETRKINYLTQTHHDEAPTEFMLSSNPLNSTASNT